MTEIGYFLSSEEHGPRALVEQARLASDVGIGSVWISDHYHPWLDEQGQSPFVWSVIGAIAASTPLAVATAVTCPTIRIHPAVIAQAAATSSLLLDGRFELGVGTGENLNEHITGQMWPITQTRLEMLEESVEVMRRLWSGAEVTHHGRHYVVENARIYSLPEAPPAVNVSGFGPHATDLAARIGPAQGVLGPGRRRVPRLAHHLWRSSGVPGELSQELRSPALFEQAASTVTVESMAKHMPCGPDVDPIVNAVQGYIDAGFDRVFLNQIGSKQKEFFRFFDHELAPALAEIGAAPDADASFTEIPSRETVTA